MKRLPIPQHEFAFVAETFGLFRDRTTDGERLARMREDAEAAHRAHEAAQRKLFPKPRGQARPGKAKRPNHRRA